MNFNMNMEEYLIRQEEDLTDQHYNELVEEIYNDDLREEEEGERYLVDEINGFQNRIIKAMKNMTPNAARLFDEQLMNAIREGLND